MSGPLPCMLQPVTIPLSWGWGSMIALRNRRYDRGRGVVHADIPVISVGNITTGGTGKTPMVQWIAERLRDAGRRPAVLLRGYGAPDPAASDEAILYRDSLEGVPVLADPDRVKALRSHLAEGPSTDCAILDDGFQHRRMHRDLDIVLLDASRPPREQRLLPAGHLREPVNALRRADAVIVTHAKEVDPVLASWVERHHGRLPLAWTDHQWTGIHVHSGNGVGNEPVSWLAGRRLVTRLGVGNPDAVRSQLRDAGAEIIHDEVARDHAPFDQAALANLAVAAGDADGLFMTGKDWVKARPLIDWSTWSTPVLVPELRLRFLDGQAGLVSSIERAVKSS